MRPAVLGKPVFVPRRTTHLVDRTVLLHNGDRRELGRQPSENRERVLAALAVLGEWPVLEPADQALLRQWIEDRVATETPEPMAELNGEFLGEWFAVSTGDRDALVEVLGLHQPMPVTMRIGWNLASVGEDRVYLTPELNGWTLIFCYFLPDREFATLRGFLVELSRRFGAAQYFYNDYGYQGWALAEHGELLRLYISGDSPESDEVVGPPHSAEIMASAGLLDDERIRRPPAVWRTGRRGIRFARPSAGRTRYQGPWSWPGRGHVGGVARHTGVVTACTNRLPNAQTSSLPDLADERSGPQADTEM
jgi:hypothetical protein